METCGIRVALVVLLPPTCQSDHYHFVAPGFETGPRVRETSPAILHHLRRQSLVLQTISTSRWRRNSITAFSKPHVMCVVNISDEAICASRKAAPSLHRQSGRFSFGQTLQAPARSIKIRQSGNWVGPGRRVKGKIISPSPAPSTSTTKLSSL